MIVDFSFFEELVSDFDANIDYIKNGGDKIGSYHYVRIAGSRANCLFYCNYYGDGGFGFYVHDSEGDYAYDFNSISKGANAFQRAWYWVDFSHPDSIGECKEFIKKWFS